jgi:hypothetical protein
VKIAYKKNFEEVVKRYQSLWAGQMRDQIMVRIQVREDCGLRDAFMANVPDIPKMFEDYVEYWRTCANLEDDILPVIAPSFGTGIEGGFFGAKVTYGSGTSWCEHIPDLLNHPEKIQYDGECESVELNRKCLQYYQNHCDGKVLTAPPIFDCADDVLYMLHGCQLYTDLIDAPDKVLALLGKISEGLERFRDEMLEMVPLYEGGFFNNWMNWWIPKNSRLIGADFWNMCSAESYRKFGFPMHQQLSEKSDVIWFHLHSVGLHLLPEIINLKNLACIEISEDPNVAIKGFELVKKVRSIVPKELIVIGAIRPNELLEGLEQHTLPGNTIYNVCEEDYQDIQNWSIDFANLLMEDIKKYKEAI